MAACGIPGYLRSGGNRCLLDEHEYCYEWQEAPFITEEMHYIFEGLNRPIRVYNDLDQRFIMEDFFAKLALNYRK